MLFQSPQLRITDIYLSLKINDQRIDRVHEFNFLGTIIHETLEWTRHIDKVANKISRTLGILNKLKHVLPVYILKTMYDALIVPHLNYNILLWGYIQTECQNNKKRQSQSQRVRNITHTQNLLVPFVLKRVQF